MWLNWRRIYLTRPICTRKHGLPKVETAIAFVNGRPGKAVITSLENLGALIESEKVEQSSKD